jgi:hypothetical protein
VPKADREVLIEAAEAFFYNRVDTKPAINSSEKGNQVWKGVPTRASAARTVSKYFRKVEGARPWHKIAATLSILSGGI